MSIPSDERYTPQRVLDAVKTAFGGCIDLDPCCGPLAPRGHAERYYDGVECDGLNLPWVGNVWVNPPYSRGQLKQWVCKAAYEITVRPGGICMLMPQDLSTHAGQWVLDTARQLVFPRGRIAFDSPDGPLKTGAKQPSVFAIWGSMSAPEVLGTVVNLRSRG